MEMARQRRPTPADRDEAVRLTLVGLIAGEEFAEIQSMLADLHTQQNTFPAEELLELAAEAIKESGATTADPIEYEAIRERYLPEYPFSGKVQHHRSHYALSASAMIRAGVYPDLLGEVVWWNDNDLWWYAFWALVIYLRIAADRSGRSFSDVARALATSRGIQVGP
jgi:hypothetical protein